MTSGVVGRRRTPAFYVRLATATVSTLLLIWFAAAQGIAAIAARNVNPVLLGSLDASRHPAAATRLAELRLRAGASEDAVEIARAGALGQPLDVRSMRVLGLALDALEDPDAAQVMAIAERLSRRDTPTSLWVLEAAGRAGDLPRVMRQIDSLARRQTQPQVVRNLLYAGLVDAPSRQALAALLGSRPPWRAGFFADARTSLQPQRYAEMQLLFEQLVRTPNPPSPAERMTLIDRMVDTGEGPAARSFWVRSFNLPVEDGAAMPFDPHFLGLVSREAGAVISPFEWRLGLDAGPFVELRRVEGRAEVIVNPGAEARTPLLLQTLTLRPGTHRIDTVLTQQTVRQAPAGWQISCRQGGGALIRSFEQQGNELSGVSVSIPQTGCSEQTLTLTAVDRFDARPITLRSVRIR